VAGGYVTAALAPNNPMRHVGVFVAWHLSRHWYPIALVVTALPCTWLGGKLKRNNQPIS